MDFIKNSIYIIGEGMQRNAQIIFNDGDGSLPPKFVSCRFRTVSNPYDYEDWKFLKEIADFIIKQKEVK